MNDLNTLSMEFTDMILSWIAVLISLVVVHGSKILHKV